MSIINGPVTELADVWEASCKKYKFKIPSPSGCAGSTPARASKEIYYDRKMQEMRKKKDNSSW